MRIRDESEYSARSHSDASSRAECSGRPDIGKAATLWKQSTKDLSEAALGEASKIAEESHAKKLAEESDALLLSLFKRRISSEPSIKSISEMWAEPSEGTMIGRFKKQLTAAAENERRAHEARIRAQTTEKRLARTAKLARMGLPTVDLHDGADKRRAKLTRMGVELTEQAGKGKGTGCRRSSCSSWVPSATARISTALPHWPRKSRYSAVTHTDPSMPPKPPAHLRRSQAFVEDSPEDDMETGLGANAGPSAPPRLSIVHSVGSTGYESELTAGAVGSVDSVDSVDSDDASDPGTPPSLAVFSKLSVAESIGEILHVGPGSSASSLHEDSDGSVHVVSERSSFIDFITGAKKIVKCFTESFKDPALTVCPSLRSPARPPPSDLWPPTCAQPTTMTSSTPSRPPVRPLVAFPPSQPNVHLPPKRFVTQRWQKANSKIIAMVRLRKLHQLAVERRSRASTSTEEDFEECSRKSCSNDGYSDQDEQKKGSASTDVDLQQGSPAPPRLPGRGASSERGITELV